MSAQSGTLTPPPPPPAPPPAPSSRPRRAVPPAGIGIAAGVIGVAVAVVALLLAGVSDDDGQADSNPSGGRAAAEIVGEAGSETPSAAPGAGSDAAVAEGSARSVIVSGTVRHLERLHLQGFSSLRAHGRVRDAAGSDLGEGTLSVETSDVEVTGSEISLGVTFLRLTADGQAVIDSNLMPDTRPGAGWSFTVHGGTATVAASALTFTPASGDGRGEDARTIGGPVTIERTGDRLQFDYEGEPITWVDPPADDLLVATAWLTWAGEGGLTFQGHHFAHEFLGVRGDGEVTLTREDGAITVRGTAAPVQIWVDGEARIKTQARVEVKSTPDPTSPGGYATFTWAPTNDGDYDMAMASIHPGNDAGRWVELALDPLPHAYGGEPRTPRGGDTDGLVYDEGGFLNRATQPISSVIRPHSGDERNIGVHVPEGAAPGRYEVVLVIEGNFDPITVTVPLEVA